MSATWTDQIEGQVGTGVFRFLIDDTHYFLIDDNYKLIIQDGSVGTWTDQPES